MTEKTCKKIENKKKNHNKMIDNRIMMKDNKTEETSGEKDHCFFAKRNAIFIQPANGKKKG